MTFARLQLAIHTRLASNSGEICLLVISQVLGLKAWTSIAQPVLMMKQEARREKRIQGSRLTDVMVSQDLHLGWGWVAYRTSHFT